MCTPVSRDGTHGIGYTSYMTTRTPFGSERRWGLAFHRGAIGMIAALILLSSGLPSGGLATILVASLVAVFVGAPLASSELARPSQPAKTGLTRALALTQEYVLVFVAGAFSGSFAGTLGGGFIAVAMWALLGMALVRFGSVTPAVISALAMIALVGAGISVIADQPWSLLEPHWNTVQQWGPTAVLMGLIAPAAGLSAWTRDAHIPGARRMPWATSGLVMVACLATALMLAGQFETGTQPLGILVVHSLAIAAVAAGSLDQGAADGVFRRVIVGGVSTLWFATVGAASIEHVTGPMLAATVLVGAVFVARRRDRHLVGAIIAATLAIAAVLVGMPPLPDATGPAVAVALSMVAAVWVVGTHSLVRR